MLTGPISSVESTDAAPPEAYIAAVDLLIPEKAPLFVAKTLINSSCVVFAALKKKFAVKKKAHEKTLEDDAAWENRVNAVKIALIESNDKVTRLIEVYVWLGGNKFVYEITNFYAKYLNKIGY